jgi:hypothetical protein
MLPGYNPDMGQTIKTDVAQKNVDRSFLAHFQVSGDDATVTNDTYVVSYMNLTDAAQEVEEEFAVPSVPRNLVVTGNVSGITGNVVIDGTNYENEDITETIALNGATPVLGAKAFKTIDTITLPVQTHTPTEQEETIEVTHAADVAGTLVFRVTAAGMANSPKDVDVEVVGTKQVETATVVGAIGEAGQGNAAVVVTAAGMTGSPITLSVAVANSDTASQVAGKIKTAMGNNANISAYFDISGSNAEIILTRKAAAANDATMNVSIDNDTCSGLTAAPASANTTAGVAFDSINSVATKIRAALNNDEDVSDFFVVGGTNANVLLTAKEPDANDSSMAMALQNADSTGVTVGASGNTTAGVPYDKVKVGTGEKLGLPYKLTHNTVLKTYLNNVLEGTAPTVTTDVDEIEKNTVDLNSSLNSSVVDVYLMV